LIFFLPNSKPCLAGKFGDSLGGSIELDTCKDCPDGFYQSTQASIECTACANGKFGDAAQQTAISSCKDCIKGTYLDQLGQSMCKDCLAGKFGDAEGATSISSCTKCPGKTNNYYFFLGCSLRLTLNQSTPSFPLLAQPDKCKIHWDKQVATIVVLVCTKMKKQKHFVCLVYLEKNKATQVKHPATIVLLIRSVKMHPRPLVNRVVLVKKRRPAVRNVLNAMPVKQEQVQVVNVNFVQKVNTALDQIPPRRAKIVLWVGRPRKEVRNVNHAKRVLLVRLWVKYVRLVEKVNFVPAKKPMAPLPTPPNVFFVQLGTIPIRGVQNVNSAVPEHTTTSSVERNAKLVHWNTPEEVMTRELPNAHDAFWGKQRHYQVPQRVKSAT